MSPSALPPTAPTTLVIMIGAGAWPNSPGFQESEAFVHAAQGFRNYLLDTHGLGLPVANLLDLFDAQISSSDQLELLGSFLEERTQALKTANQAARDLLVYFVGHGGFAGPSADFYLLLRRTNASSLRASGMAMDALAEVLREKARQLRRYLFLDCCFAAAAFRAFQGGPDQTAITKTLDAFTVQARSSGFPRRGTVLLCSSDQKSPSLLLPDESCTMFSYALLDVLKNGDLHRPRQLSLRDLKELAEDRLATLPERNAPRPGLHSPDQSEGDVADIPFFPNPYVERELARIAERERRRQTEQERLVEEEQRRRLEEEQTRKAKEEHVRQTEEEKRREAMEERRRRRMAKRTEQTRLGMETHVQNIANQTSPIQNQTLPTQQPRLDLSIQARQAEQERLSQAEEKERVRDGETERLHQTEEVEQIGKFAGSLEHTSQSRTTPSLGTNVVQSEDTSKRSSGFSRWRYLLGFGIFLFGALFVGQYERSFLESNHMDKVLFQIGSFAVTTSTVLYLLTLILLLVILAFFNLIPRSIKRSRG
jgi:hypothetical protein